MPDDTCDVADCELPAAKRCWCSKHYQRWRKYGDPLVFKNLPRGQCSVPGCEDNAHARELCVKHWNRWRRHGDPTYTKFIVGDDVQRFWSNVQTSSAPGECWPWLASTASGYGQIHFGGQFALAHRVAYELMVGPIPDGLTLDHLCHDPDLCDLASDCPHRRCVNPSHVEPVSGGVNILRGGGLAALNARKEECDHGHAFDEANTYVDPRGKRACRACRRLAESRARRRRASC